MDLLKSVRGGVGKGGGILQIVKAHVIVSPVGWQAKSRLDV